MATFRFSKLVEPIERSRFTINSDKRTSWQNQTLTYVTHFRNQEKIEF